MQARLEVDAIAFDVGNTLTTSPMPDVLAAMAPAFCEILQRRGANVAQQALIEAWDKANREVHFPFASHFMQEEPIVQEALRRLGVPADVRALAAPELLVLCRRAIRGVLEDRDLDELIACLDDLRERGKRLAILSNDRSFATPTLLKWMGLADRFGLVTVSEETGHEKPAPQAFDVLIARLGLPPERIAYIGDDTVRDMAAGQRAGLKVILWRPGGRELEETSWATSQEVAVTPDAVLTAWSDLPDLVA